MSRDPSLRCDRHLQPAQPRHHEGLETRVRVGHRGVENPPCVGRQRQPPERMSIDEPIPQRGLPHGEGRLIRLACRHDGQHVLDRVGERIGMRRNERLRPVRRDPANRDRPGVRRRGNVWTVAGEYPQPETLGLRDARDHDPVAGRGDQVAVGRRHRDPALANPDESPGGETLFDAMATETRLLQEPGANDTSGAPCRRGNSVGRATGGRGPERAFEWGRFGPGRVHPIERGLWKSARVRRAAIGGHLGHPNAVKGESTDANPRRSALPRWKRETCALGIADLLGIAETTATTCGRARTPAPAAVCGSRARARGRAPCGYPRAR